MRAVAAAVVAAIVLSAGPAHAQAGVSRAQWDQLELQQTYAQVAAQLGAGELTSVDAYPYNGWTQVCILRKWSSWRTGYGVHLRFCRQADSGRPWRLKSALFIPVT